MLPVDTRRSSGGHHFAFYGRDLETREASNMCAVYELGLFIDGKWMPGKSGKRINVINPANGQLVGSVPIATRKEVATACQSAQCAYEVGRSRSAVERCQYLQNVATLISERNEEIALVVSRETGQPLAQAKGEVLGFCNLLRFYAEEVRRIRGQVLPADHTDRMVSVLKEPVGVVAAIPPWNFPLVLLARMLGPALAAGCTVVAKPSSETPLSTLLVAQLASQAGLPPGAFNVITGSGKEVGEWLIQDPRVRKVAFTGSLEVGKRVMALAAEGIKRVTLELGGQCPAIVWKGADVDRAAEAIVFQGFRNCGQVCNRVNRVYVYQATAEEFIARLVELSSRLVVGGSEEADIGPLINKRQLDWVDSHVQDALSKGAKLECGGSRLHGPGYDAGYFYAPTVLSNCNHSMRVMTEETFGPVLAVQTVGDDLGEALRLANDTPYGLSAFFFGRDLQDCFRAMHALEAGSVWINDIHGSYVQAPYGGMKESGIGREQGSVAVDEYVELKTIYFDFAEHRSGPRLCVHR